MISPTYVIDEIAETGVFEERGRRRQQSFIQAAPNELKLGEGGKVMRASHWLGGGVGEVRGKED